MARKHKTKRRRKNPAFNPKRRRFGRRRYKRNPEFQLSTASMTNTFIDGGVAAVGGVGAAWTANMFGIEGNMKYVYMLGFALLGGFLLQKLNTGIARPFALGAIAVTAYTFAQDKELLAGLSGNGGDQLTLEDWKNLNELKAAIGNGGELGFVPQENMLGFIPQGTEIAGAEGGFDIDAGNSAY